MPETNNRNAAVLFIILLLFIVISLIIVDIINIMSKKGECIRNPLVYGVKEWENKNKINMSCTCYFDDGSLLRVTDRGVSQG